MVHAVWFLFMKNYITKLCYSVDMANIRQKKRKRGATVESSKCLDCNDVF